MLRGDAQTNVNNVTNKSLIILRVVTIAISTLQNRYKLDIVTLDSTHFIKGLMRVSVMGSDGPVTKISPPAAKTGPPRTDFGSQKWSPLQISVPLRNLNRQQVIAG